MLENIGGLMLSSRIASEAINYLSLADKEYSDRKAEFANQSWHHPPRWPNKLMVASILVICAATASVLGVELSTDSMSLDQKILSIELASYSAATGACGLIFSQLYNKFSKKLVEYRDRKMAFINRFTRNHYYRTSEAYDDIVRMAEIGQISVQRRISFKKLGFEYTATDGLLYGPQEPGTAKHDLPWSNRGAIRPWDGKNSRTKMCNYAVQATHRFVASR